jgi:hypothetical protein
MADGRVDELVTEGSGSLSHFFWIQRFDMYLFDEQLPSAPVAAVLKRKVHLAGATS